MNVFNIFVFCWSKYFHFHTHHWNNNTRKNGPLENWYPEKWSPEKCPSSLFFIFIDWFHYTHKKMFDVHLTILHSPNCRTLKNSRKVCCWILGFHRLITSEKSTHTTILDAHVAIFWFWISQDHFSGDQFAGDHFSRRPFFLETIFPGTIFPGTIFPGTIFPGDHFSWGPFFRDSK